MKTAKIEVQDIVEGLLLDVFQDISEYTTDLVLRKLVYSEEITHLLKEDFTKKRVQKITPTKDLYKTLIRCSLEFRDSSSGKKPTPIDLLSLLCAGSCNKSTLDYVWDLKRTMSNELDVLENLEQAGDVFCWALKNFGNKVTSNDLEDFKKDSKDSKKEIRHLEDEINVLKTRLEDLETEKETLEEEVKAITLSNSL